MSPLATPAASRLFRNPVTQFEIRLFFHSGRYHEYWLWQNQFQLFSLCGASSGQMLHSFLRIPALLLPTQNTAGMESGAGNWKWGSCCDAATKVPAAISSERVGLVHADRCALALSNLSHRPSGENSSQARDAMIKSQPHFGFSVVFCLCVEARTSPIYSILCNNCHTKSVWPITSDVYV